MSQVKFSSDDATKEKETRVKGSEIFIGGMARSTTESMIREVFSSCGEIVEIRLMKDQNGTSKGFCFVRFATKEAAFKAQKEKDGFRLDGKKLGVALSSDQDSLFLGNLHKGWGFEEFDKMVRQAFQDVVSVDLAMPSSTGDFVDKKKQNRGFAFVQFSSHAAAARAHRLGSKPEFLLGDKWHPVVDWAEKEPEIDPEELVKIKVAFVGNLPKNASEEYLKKLFEPFGKLEKVALSRKSHFPVGFIHFAQRSELENAIKEMDGKTIKGPENGPEFKIQVSVARPVEKDRKRVRDESQSKATNKLGTSATSSKDSKGRSFADDHKPKAPRLDSYKEVPDITDPYEKAVASLPSPLTERLLRIFRLGIATRYDIDIQLITSLKELPISAAILVLDRFLLAPADGYNKGGELAGLIARYQVDKVGLGRNPSHVPGKTRDFAPKESDVHSLHGLSHAPAFDPVISRSAGTALARYESFTPSPGLYPSSLSAQDDPFSPQNNVGKIGEMGSRASYQMPLSSGYRSIVMSESRHSPHVDHLAERSLVRFDPFTGEPYKFDPFTGKPIQPESSSQRSGSLY